MKLIKTASIVKLQQQGSLFGEQAGTPSPRVPGQRRRKPVPSGSSPSLFDQPKASPRAEQPSWRTPSPIVPHRRNGPSPTFPADSEFSRALRDAEQFYEQRAEDGEVKPPKAPHEITGQPEHYTEPQADDFEYGPEIHVTPEPGEPGYDPAVHGNPAAPQRGRKLWDKVRGVHDKVRSGIGNLLQSSNVVATGKAGKLYRLPDDENVWGWTPG